MVTQWGLVSHQAATFSFSFLLVFSLVPLRCRPSVSFVVSFVPYVLLIPFSHLWIGFPLQPDVSNILLSFSAAYGIFAGSHFLMARNRNAMTLFIVLTSLTGMLPGHIAGCLVFLLTGIDYASLFSTGVANAVTASWLIETARKHSARRLAIGQASWMKLCLAPLAFAFLSPIAIPFELLEAFDFKAFPLIVSAAFSLCLSYILVVHCILSHAAANSIKTHHDSLRELERHLDTESKRVGEAHADVMRYRHDLRHVLSMVRSGIREDCSREIASAIGDLRLPDIGKGFEYLCDDALLNSVLNDAQGKAYSQEVALNIRVALSGEPCTYTVSFAAAVANLMENAINAASASSTKTVSIEIKSVKRNLIVRIENSFEGKLRINKTSGLPISRKNDSHGWGLVNVDAFVKEYNGIIDFAYENRLVIIRLSIPLCRNRQDSSR